MLTGRESKGRSIANRVFASFVFLLVACLGLAAHDGSVLAEDAEITGMVTPEYDGEGQLKLPTDFRKWVFVGSSLGLSYFGDEKEISEQIFHHIYMQPEAYQQRRLFPDQELVFHTAWGWEERLETRALGIDCEVSPTCLHRKDG